MKKINLSLLGLGILILAGVGYYLLSENKDQQNMKNNSADIGSDVNFEDIGYVYSKKIVSGLNSDDVYPRAEEYDIEYHVVYPGKEIDRKIFSESKFPSTYEIIDSYESLSDDLLKISLISELGVVPHTTVQNVTMMGELVDGPSESLWADGEVKSPNSQYAAVVNITPSLSTDVPEPPTFESLDIINQDNEVLHSYKAENFSDLGGIFPVAFSPDSESILLKAQDVRPQELFSPQIYFIQPLGGEKQMIAQYNTDAYPQGSEYNLSEVSLMGFLNSGTLYGTQTLETYTNFSPQERKESFITFSLGDGVPKDSGVTYRDLVGINSENGQVFFLNESGTYYSYNFLTTKTVNLSGNFFIPSYDFLKASSDYNYLVYTKTYEQEAEARATLPVNGPYNLENVTEYWVYDVKSHAREKILTNMRHKGGDALGDEFYEFVGFVN